MTPLAPHPAFHALASRDQPALHATGRILLAVLFVASGVQKIFAFDSVAAWMSSAGLPFASAALVLTIVLEVAGGLAFALGLGARLLAWTLAAFVVVASIVFHAFWSVPADQFGDQLTHFLKNLAIAGGLLMVVACGPGRLSLDGRRARRSP